MPFVYVGITVMAVAIAIFALQNADPVSIRFLAWRLDGAPLAAVILLSGAAGAVLATVVGLLQRWRLRAQIRQLKSRLKAAEPATHAERHG
ncbi:MAG: LapA family protein [Candidatus Rokubacteria bacterium]|nr:LapA family protein [Candidatus Rokubacteria bacterium]